MTSLLSKRASRPYFKLQKISAALFFAIPASLWAADTNSDTELQNKVDLLQKEMQQLTSGMANSKDVNEGLPMHGFIDVRAKTESDDSSARGFELGNLDFYLTPQFTHNVKALVELNFEVGNSGGVSPDLERLQLGYQPVNWLTLWMGRFHTPYGYWHDAFHHGAQIQTSIYRPKFLDFEDAGGILPAHSNGLWGHGSTKAMGGTVTYDLYTANSPRLAMDDPTSSTSIATLDPNLLGTQNKNYTAGTNLSYKFNGALNGFILGIDALTGNVSNDSIVTPTKTQLSMTGLWTAYLENDFEILAEYYHFNNKDLSGNGDTYASKAGYIQIGYSFDVIEPYVRYEKTTLDQADNYFAEQESGASYKRAAAGFKYDIDPKASFKLEADSTKQTDREIGTSHRVTVQYAVRF